MASRYNNGKHLINSGALVDGSIIGVRSENTLYVLEFNPLSGSRIDSSPDFNFDDIMRRVDAEYIGVINFETSQHIDTLSETST